MLWRGRHVGELLRGVDLGDTSAVHVEFGRNAALPMPARLVFLEHQAAQTSAIRPGTGIVTLPIETRDYDAIKLFNGLMIFWRNKTNTSRVAASQGAFLKSASSNPAIVLSAMFTSLPLIYFVNVAAE